MSNETGHPSERELALEDFLKSFRIALNFICLYNKNHKSFILAVVELKSRLDAVLAFSSPMTIMFSANALSIDGIIFEKKQLYLDLAKQLHFRKSSPYNSQREFPQMSLLSFCPWRRCQLKSFWKKEACSGFY